MKAAGKAMVAGTGKPIKVLYGCEGYYVNDVDDRVVVHGLGDMDFSGAYVAFDLETTGLSSLRDEIIEIGGGIPPDRQGLGRVPRPVYPGPPPSPKI